MADKQASDSPHAAPSPWLIAMEFRAFLELEVEQFALPAAPPVPTTSIFSRTAGVVAWPASIQAPSETNPQTENLEVIASHIGLGLNPSPWWAVADRLAQREGQWRAFERKRGLHGMIFPDPNR